MSSIADAEHKKAAAKLKMVMATYKDAEDLINIGAYKAGSNPNIDYAVSKIDGVNGFLCQETGEKVSLDETIGGLEAIFEEGGA